MDQNSSNLPLTKRQAEILSLIQSGLSNKEVARKLNISDGTVKQHLVMIYRRLNVNNRTKAAQIVTQAEDESFFLSPIQNTNDPNNRNRPKSATFAASLQPISCIKIHLSLPNSLLHQIGSIQFNQFNQHLREACKRAADRFGGVVQGSIDGPLILFGIRHMREDDPIRALHCAGLIMHTMIHQTADLALEEAPIKITVHSGDIITCTNGSTTTVQGELLAPTQSTNKQSATCDNKITLSPNTAQAIERLHARHGKILPHFPGSSTCLSSAIKTGNDKKWMTPFIGRNSELETLHTQLAETLQGRSQTMLVVGEAGFGETRLIQKFQEELTHRNEIQWLTSHCHSVTQMVPLHPFLPLLETMAQCDTTAPVAQRWEQLQRWVNRLTAPMAQTGQLILSLLQEDQPLPKIEAGAPILDEIIDFFLTTLTTTLPPAPSAIILYLDNLQWMDPYSRLLFPKLANRLNGTHIWLLGVGRKAELRTLATHPAIQLYTITRLPNRDILRLLKHMPIAKRLDSSQLKLLVEWSRGVPLFAVEMAQSLAQVKKSELMALIHSGDLFPDTLLCMILERVHALTGIDWKVLRALAAGRKEITMDYLRELHLHDDAKTTEAVVTHLFQAGLIKINEQQTGKIIVFSNEMVRAAIRKTLPASDLI